MENLIKIAIASKNPIKITAAKEACMLVFEKLNTQIQFEAFDAESGVSAQPSTQNETLAGAINRCRHLKELQPNFDYYIGQEGGTFINPLDSCMWTAAIVVVMQKNGKYMFAQTLAYRLPDAVSDLVTKGYELGKANDMIFTKQNSKQGLGASGLYTNGLLPRSEVYMPAIIMALSQLLDLDKYRT